MSIDNGIVIIIVKVKGFSLPSIISDNTAYQKSLSDNAAAYQTDVFSGDRSILAVGLTHCSGSNLESQTCESFNISIW